MSGRTGPLQHLTIIDCTMALAGPYGTALLADLGANVIKVEPPTGDGSRFTAPRPPDFARPGDPEPGAVDFGGYFASINRNKRSIVLDLKDADDREVFLKLCEQADAIIENVRDGVMDRLGVGYEVIRSRNPRIVYGCIRGFGDRRTGESPYADRPAYDIVAQAMGGHVHLTGPQGHGGYPGGSSTGDIFPGTLMALGVVSAVLHARETGVGQFLDVAMYDAVVAMCETAIVNYGYDNTELGPRGAHHPNLMPFGLYSAKDGNIAIAAPKPKQWEFLCRAMGKPELLEQSDRLSHRDTLHETITDWTRNLTRAEIVAAIGDDVPCGPVNRASDIYADPHVEARQMITYFELPGDNPTVAIAGNPIKLTETPTGFYRRAPMLGEHTEEVLTEFGIVSRTET